MVGYPAIQLYTTSEMKGRAKPSLLMKGRAQPSLLC